MNATLKTVVHVDTAKSVFQVANHAAAAPGKHS